MSRRRNVGGGRLTRRNLVALLGGAAALRPLATSAQPKAMPVIGFVHLHSPELTREYLAAFHRGLADAGFVEGKNLRIEYRWGEAAMIPAPSIRKTRPAQRQPLLVAADPIGAHCVVLGSALS